MQLETLIERITISFNIAMYIQKYTAANTIYKNIQLQIQEYTRIYSCKYKNI